jgi:hypothetical protein
VKVIFSVLIILEVALIASRYSLDFDNYITVVIILLLFPLAFFSYHYLRIAYREASDSQRFSKRAFRSVPDEIGGQTEQELRKLVESAAYKEFEKMKKMRVEQEE